MRWLSGKCPSSPLPALRRISYGPMLTAKHRARTTGKVLRDGAQPLGGEVGLETVEVPKYRAFNMWVPLVILIGMAVFCMW